MAPTKKSKNSPEAVASPSSSGSQLKANTGRSHEENQERAYIAASRRTDRSIEARVQSARMASEIHKKRTGKSFRITEEIVIKEEMYEEEDDIYLRSYRRLGSNMQTSSANMNSRAEAFINNKVAMSSLAAKTDDDWRENEINKLFAQSFGNVTSQVPRMVPQVTPQQIPQPAAMNMAPTSPLQAGFPPVNFPAPQPAVQQLPIQQPPVQAPMPQPPLNANLELQFATGLPSGPTEMPLPTHQLDAMPRQPPFHVDSPIDLGPRQTSAFTPRMSPEGYLLTPGSETGTQMDQQLQEWLVADALYNPRDAAKFGNTLDMTFPTTGMSMGVMEDPMAPVDDQPQWDAFINDSAWAQE
ncbi:Putative Pc18g03370 protein [[Torrubiella] hemipterigena]|uniref:Putative Pc18g03370 protein n=1 Tax=[Torrubiella] hemipterigena TaxID=1531966 RepID=A0A0A1TN50_9HYPO|nr:Putative Pc18g03370 protein [[Torrubiella] hemipterigena]